MSAQRILVAPSILAADFGHLADDLHRVIAAGADWLHLDIMDGQFVDNISFGPAIVKLVRGLTTLPLDVHLMIERADHYVPRFVEAGANSITVHVEPEAKHDVAETLRLIRAQRLPRRPDLEPCDALCRRSSRICLTSILSLS